jgi:hypothetical protein
MTTPDPPRKPAEALDAHIDELESLLHEPASPEHRDIPILDDLVDAGDLPPTLADGEPAAAIAEIEQRLARRLQQEFDDLSEVIIRVVRRCLREELESGPVTGEWRREQPRTGED